MTTVQEHDVDIQQSWQQSWQAVQTRDRRFDGRFVYAVKSTGVYCNPSCPSRRPQPEQVRFFTGPAEAQSAGFRACRRCLPDRLARESDRSALVQRACNYIDQAIRDQAAGDETRLPERSPKLPEGNQGNPRLPERSPKLPEGNQGNQWNQGKSAPAGCPPSPKSAWP